MARIYISGAYWHRREAVLGAAEDWARANGYETEVSVERDRYTDIDAPSLDGHAKAELWARVVDALENDR